MAKDPAVLLYTQDFLVGTLTMDYEQVGKYIKLLCLQHQKNGLSESELKSISENDELVMEKFTLIEGKYYNIRMKEEAERRANFTKSRRDNGNKGGRPKTTIKPNDIPNKNLMDNHMVNHMDNHMEAEAENENVIEDEYSINTKIIDKILDRILQYENTKLHKEALEDLQECGGINRISEVLQWDESVKQNWLRAINQSIQIHNDK